MIPVFYLPIMTTALTAVGGWAAVWTCGADARAAREAAHQQELRDIDAWLAVVRKS